VTPSVEPQEPAGPPMPAETLSNTALLVVDVQQDLVRNGHDAPQVLANITQLVDRARTAGQPVVWIQHDDEGLPKGSAGWQLAPELVPAPSEPMVEKQFGDPFEATGLREILVGLGVGSVIVVGVQTEWCIRSTLHGALVRGFNTTLVGDAHTTDDLSDQGATLTADQTIRFTNGYWRHTEAPGRTCQVVATAEVDF